MFVRNHMTPSPVTAAPEVPVDEALALMQMRSCRHLPVLAGRHLVGLVTKRLLLTALAAGDATAPTVGRVMVDRPVTVTPDCPVEEAALLMREHRIGCLPVLEGGYLAGIITQTDMVEALVRFFGLHHPGVRLVVETHHRTGALAEITALVHRLGIPVLGIACLELPEGGVQTVLRLAAANPAPVVTALMEKGLKIRV